MIEGDPHVKVKVPGQEAICFEIDGMDGDILDILSDRSTGLEVNGQLIQEGSQRRLERVFIKTPRDVEIGIYSNSVTLGYDGHASRRFSFEEDTEFGIADAHVEITRFEI